MEAPSQKPPQPAQPTQAQTSSSTNPPQPALDPELVKVLLENKFDRKTFDQLLKSSNTLMDESKSYQEKLKEKANLEEQLKQAKQVIDQLNGPKREKVQKSLNDAVKKLKLQLDESAMKEIISFVDSPTPGHQALANILADYGDVIMQDTKQPAPSAPAAPAAPVVTDTAVREAARQTGFSAKRKRPADEEDEEEDKLFEKRQKDMDTSTGIKRLVGVEASSSSATNGEIDYKALVKKLNSRFQTVGKTGSNYLVENMPHFNEIIDTKK